MLRLIAVLKAGEPSVSCAVPLQSVTMPISINPHIFRAYDIRGKADIDITPEFCLLVGKAFGTELRERYNIVNPKVIVGWDARTHSPLYAQSVIEGLRSTGCFVNSIGMTPTPLNYFTVCERGQDGSIQVTASHNPKEDNGLKLQIRHAEAFSDDQLQLLRKRIDSGVFLHGDGSVVQIDPEAPYFAFLKKMFDAAAKGLNVVVDSGNGAAGPVYCEAIRRAGAIVTELYTKPDGTFPNHIADPSKHDSLKDLQAKVIEAKADVGIAFDGDGDRLGVVDETGAIRTPDDLLLLLAHDLLDRHPHTSVVFTVSNSSALESEIKKFGGKPVMCKVGHSFVEHAMREENALLGGEQSGHFFCWDDYFQFDDALVAALHVLRILNEKKQSLSAALAEFPRVYATHEIRPHCDDDKKVDVVRRATEYFETAYTVHTLDGARIDFGENAWAGIRVSNTSPRISVCMEARSPQKLAEIKSIVLTHLRTYPEIHWEEDE